MKFWYVEKGTTTSAAWNELTSVEETSSTELKSFWLDGVKYLDNLLPGDFSGKLSAFTYPDEFDSVNGIVDVAPGLTYYDQPSKSFNLTYRTQVGNDLDGIDYGYKIHLLYNITANPDSYKFESLKEQASAIEFSWTLVGTPPAIHGYRPTVHVSIDSNETDPDTLKYIEDILYGTATTDPYFPTINEILDLFKNLGSLIIVDNGDGTWQAIDQANTYITMISSTEFQIDGADATYLDATTYEISTTNPD